MLRANLLGFVLVALSTNLAFANTNKSEQKLASFARMDSAKEVRAARKVARSFAASHLLGTGSDQYVTDVELVSSTEAKAIIGQDDDKNAYAVKLKKRSKSWKIVSYEYIFIPTGKTQIDTLTPPFPDPIWTRIIRQQ